MIWIMHSEDILKVIPAFPSLKARNHIKIVIQLILPTIT